MNDLKNALNLLDRIMIADDTNLFSDQDISFLFEIANLQRRL